MRDVLLDVLCLAEVARLVGALLGVALLLSLQFLQENVVVFELYYQLFLVVTIGFTVDVVFFDSFHEGGTVLMHILDEALVIGQHLSLLVVVALLQIHFHECAVVA